MTRRPAIESTRYAYTAVFEADKTGGFVVTFPAIPDLATQGDTLEHARAMAADCLQGHLEFLRERGWPIPKPDQPANAPLKETIRVELKSA